MAGIRRPFATADKYGQEQPQIGLSLTLVWTIFYVDDHPAGRCAGLDAQDFAALQHFVKFFRFRHRHFSLLS
jgi:hypothetical protein